ncbi:hypothetical protein AVEN_30961-1 [Araneus ventricosus]|uniref:Uncharacterized protein n=1 Tax=Araneus ventricosus TaxID=182803 RepID=A0A4Y2RQ51_ARAVE|nr:hypothetical protein AVEN_30961-1 [Araneus ventricosus]
MPFPPTACPPRPHTPPPLPPVTRTSLSLREEIEELYEDTVLEDHKRPVSLIKCSESAADRVSSPPLNEERLAPPMERITARICSIQLGTYSNYSARGILGYLSGPGIIAFGRSHLWRD